MSEVTLDEGPPGPSFVSGSTDARGHPVLTREDGSTATVSNIILTTGSIVGNGDGTCTLTVP